MKNFSILETSIGIWKLLKSVVSLWLLSSRHQSDLVHLEHWLKKIGTAVVHDTLELLIAWVVPETVVVKMGLVDFDWGSLVAHHELLEGQETEVPTITLFVCDELGNGRWGLKHRSNLELPNASINISVSHEWSPVLEMLWLVGGHWHLSNIRDHVFIVN
jgi:hypothetical protein